MSKFIVFVIGVVGLCVLIAFPFLLDIAYFPGPPLVGYSVAIVLLVLLVLLIFKIVAYLRLSWHEKLFIFVMVATIDYLVFSGIARLAGISGLEVLRLFMTEIASIELAQPQVTPLGFFSLWSVSIIATAIVTLGYRFMSQVEEITKRRS